MGAHRLCYVLVYLEHVLRHLEEFFHDFFFLSLCYHVLGIPGRPGRRSGREPQMSRRVNCMQDVPRVGWTIPMACD